MTEQARAALADCLFAWHKLEHCSDSQTFRVFWVAGVVLARTIGDVLRKVDSEFSPTMKLAIREAFETRQKDAVIFTQFIKAERDQLIHQYDTNVYADNVITLGIELNGTIEPSNLDECIFKPLESGFYAGEDARDVLKLAIDWWSSELDWIDGKILEIEKN